MKFYVFLTFGSVFLSLHTLANESLVTASTHQPVLDHSKHIIWHQRRVSVNVMDRHFDRMKLIVEGKEPNL